MTALSSQNLQGERLVAPVSSPSLTNRKIFKHTIDIYLKDSNATGNIYFARYFEWQGICRERWFLECISSDMLAPLGIFITKNAQQQYIQEIFAFQKVECEVSTYLIKQCSFSILFYFFVDGELVSTGNQQIVFTNKAKKITRLPEHILEKIRDYERSDYLYKIQHTDY